jgi:hypothetical protein
MRTGSRAGEQKRDLKGGESGRVGRAVGAHPVRLSGLAYQGPSARLVEQLHAGAFEAVLCPMLLAELRRTLAKPYFARRLSAEQASGAVDGVTALSVLFDGPGRPAPRAARLRR